MQKENKMYFTKIYGTPPVFVPAISENLDVFYLKENNGYGYTYKYNNFETLSKNKIDNEYTVAADEIRYSRGKKYNKKQDFHVFETKILKSNKNTFSKICIIPNFSTIITSNEYILSEQKGCQILKDKNTNTECAVLVSVNIEKKFAKIINKKFDLNLALGLKNENTL